MKCPNCGEEVREADKFCGECGKPIRREIEIAPKWKWGSMIASLVIVLIFWIICIAASFTGESYTDPVVLIILLIFGLPATIYLMYKERTEKIKYGLAWISFPILTFHFTLEPYPDSAFEAFLLLAIPAIVIDVIYVIYVYKQDKRK